MILGIIYIDTVKTKYIYNSYTIIIIHREYIK